MQHASKMTCSEFYFSLSLFLSRRFSAESEVEQLLFLRFFDRGRRGCGGCSGRGGQLGSLGATDVDLGQLPRRRLAELVCAAVELARLADDAAAPSLRQAPVSCENSIILE